MLENARITYTINLEKNVKLSYRSIYIFSERELRILRDYFTKKKIID